jgi:hypothetical protein
MDTTVGTTWGLFLVAHMSAVAYAVVNVGDARMALIFSGNALCCLAILAVALLKRRRHQEAQSRLLRVGAPLDTSNADVCDWRETAGGFRQRPTRLASNNRSIVDRAKVRRGNQCGRSGIR